MKILRVSSDLYPSIVGGVGLHAHEMSKDQSNLGHEVVMYTAAPELRSKYQIKYNYKIKRFKPLIKLFGNSIVPNMFVQMLKNRYKYDIIHAHSHLCFSTNICAIMKKFGSSPLVITTHGGLNSQTAPAWFQRIYNLTGAKFTFSSADKIICYTNTEREEMINFGIKPEKIALIHNGIDTNLFVPPKDNLRQNNYRLLWIGRYVPGKGVEYLIDAFSILKTKYPNASLMMIGTGPLKEKIDKKINSLNLNESIIKKDFMPNSEIIKIYHNSNILILPSLGEGVPRVILEAMACGLPIVCTELPQLVDLLNGCGFMVPLRDSRAMAEEISQILSDPNLAQKLGDNGRKKVVGNYSWNDTINKTIKLYEELI